MDFSTPRNFPKEIVKAIKNGEFDCFFSEDLLSLLNLKGKKKYQEIEQSAWKKYQEIVQPAFWKLFKQKTYRNKKWQ